MVFAYTKCLAYLGTSLLASPPPCGLTSGFSVRLSITCACIQPQRPLSKFCSMPTNRFPQFIRNVTQRKGLTHYLCLPVLTEESRSLFRASFTHLLNHPSSAAIPPGAFRPPGTLHLKVGTLRLETSQRTAAAIELLRNLQVDEILKECPVSPVSEEYRSQTVPSFAGSMTSRAKTIPLSITLSRLFCKPGLEAATLTLSVVASDPTRRLGLLLKSIRHTFTQAGLLDYPGPGYFNPDEHPIRVMNLRSKGPIVRHGKKPTKLKTKTPSKIDARPLLEQFKDEVWVEGARLEKLSLCKLGLATEIMRAGGNLDSQMGLNEIFSVPLP